MSALLAGRREEARLHTERARALPGADARVGVLLAVLAWPQVQRRLLEAPGEVETELAVERLLGELDEAVAGDPSPAAAALRELRQRPRTAAERAAGDGCSRVRPAGGARSSTTASWPPTAWTSRSTT